MSIFTHKDVTNQKHFYLFQISIRSINTSLLLLIWTMWDYIRIFKCKYHLTSCPRSEIFVAVILTNIIRLNFRMDCFIIPWIINYEQWIKLIDNMWSILCSRLFLNQSTSIESSKLGKYKCKPALIEWCWINLWRWQCLAHGSLLVIFHRGDLGQELNFLNGRINSVPYYHNVSALSRIYVIQ